jgi:hypothetical protein
MVNQLTVAYLIAGVLFIRSLGGLSKQETAFAGNTSGMLGMALAVLVTVISWVSDDQGSFAMPSGAGLGLLVGAIVVGAGVGGVLAQRVEMTGMPELVADAAQLRRPRGRARRHLVVPLAPRRARCRRGRARRRRAHVHLVEMWIGVAVGAITFTGSIVAWGKLRGTISGKPLLLPGGTRSTRRRGPAIVGSRCPSSAPPDAGGGLLPWLLARCALAGAARRAPRHGHRRRGHARGGVAAQQLLGLGGGLGGLRARQRSAHRHGRARRRERHHPLDHHVPRDEPLDPQRGLRRLRHRRRRDARDGAAGAPGRDARAQGRRVAPPSSGGQER